MKTLKKILLFVLPAFVAMAFAQAPEVPLKTVIIKDPVAADPQKYFSTITSITFWVHKAGSNEDVEKAMKTFKAEKNIKSSSEGKVTGDYKEFSLVLNAAQNKSWFAALFKKAGFGHIKINNNGIIPIDKL